ncbi:anti-sigma factor family protein [Embleya sp. AB8]|uniref:anti-sigma factor family protein n=1 Tax=Embleya sp. AB8 TaxID=3156304 RepID=UPI003C76F544
MSGRPEHADIAAYALGLLTPADRGTFEEHLATCDRCLDELAGFSGLATLLTELRDERVYALPAPVEGREPSGPSGPSVVTALPLPAAGPVPVDVPAAGPPARRRLSGLVAACVAILVIGLGAGVLTGRTWFRPDSATSAQSVPVDPIAALARNGEVVTATGANNGATARIALASQAWGTDVALELTNVHGPLKCALVAVDKSGNEQRLATWTVPDSGYGVPGSAAPLVVRTGTWTARDQLARFEVRTSDGGTLVGVPV